MGRGFDGGKCVRVDCVSDSGVCGWVDFGNIILHDVYITADKHTSCVLALQSSTH